MNRLSNYLNKKAEELRKIIDVIQRRKGREPEGSLQISVARGVPRFYNLVENEEHVKNKIYLGKDQRDLAKALAQKDYEKRLLKTATDQLNAIQSFQRRFDNQAVYDVFAKLSPQRQALVEAGTLNTEEYVRRWESVPYTPGSFEENAPDFQTMKKERVRSKSEQIIADWFYNKKMPYRYEYPWRMKDGRTIHPDFTLLNVQTREVFVFEHFGRMDDPNYVNGNFLPKMRTYMENGFFPGEKLLFTMESKEHPFTTVQLEQLISHYFPISQ